jgi:2-polyprenyl-3-methyl-5-hydroxy-6-metoxy-1,4-benzoquinol methylase
MEQKISRGDVVSYYNEHIKHKVNDFVAVNPRIEEAWKTLTSNAPANPLRILEVGCGSGSVSWRMHKYWPNAKITGIDISTQSIEIAKQLFSNDKTNFIETILTPDVFNEQFDLIVFMDVYEHIAVQDRPAVHASLLKLLKNEGRIFLSVPTPHNLKWSLINKPETMQPVDEHISFDVIGKLASDTCTEVMLYQIISVWNVGDYAHIILEKNSDFEAAFFKPKPVNIIQRGKRILGKLKNKLTQPIRSYYVRRKLK